MLFYEKIFSNDDIDHFTEVTTFIEVITFTDVTTFTDFLEVFLNKFFRFTRHIAQA